MKNTLFYLLLFIFFITFSPVLFGGGQYERNLEKAHGTSDNVWNVEKYLDRWGNETNNWYMEYVLEPINANLTNSRQRDAEVSVIGLKFSDTEGFLFRSTGLRSFENHKGELFFRNSSGKEFGLEAVNFTDGTVIAEYSEELETFLRSSPEELVFTVPRILEIRFDIPMGFAVALERLLSK